LRSCSFLPSLPSHRQALRFTSSNITNHKGYDNQPYFHPDEPVIYYSSFNEEGRSDIKSYNYKTGVTSNITTTSEREYSPTVTPISNTYPVSFSATTMHRSLANTPSRVVSLLF